MRRDTDKGGKERDGRNGEREERRKDKTIQVKNGDELFWLEQKWTKNCWTLFLGKKIPSLKLPFPDQYSCSIVAFRTMLGEMKLLLHLPSLITKTYPKGKLVL